MPGSNPASSITFQLTCFSRCSPVASIICGAVLFVASRKMDRHCFQGLVSGWGGVSGVGGWGGGYIACVCMWLSFQHTHEESGACEACAACRGGVVFVCV